MEKLEISKKNLLINQYNRIHCKRASIEDYITTKTIDGCLY